MHKQIRHGLILLAVFCVVPFYLLCQAQPPENANAAQEVPRSLLTGGPIEPLRDMAGAVEVRLLRSTNDRESAVKGDLIGLDGNWVVVRVDHLTGEPKRSTFQWIPVVNIERMIQTTVYPQRLSRSAD